MILINGYRRALLLSSLILGSILFYLHGSFKYNLFAWDIFNILTLYLSFHYFLKLFIHSETRLLRFKKIFFVIGLKKISLIYKKIALI